MEMAIVLRKVTKDEIEKVWKMQVEAFSGLLEKYRDYEISPAAEAFEKVLARFMQPWTTYFFIVDNGIDVGAVRVVRKENGRKRISPIWIMPEYRGHGFAQQAMTELERMYGSSGWCLDTILQEGGNVHLYEKMGYRRTGKVEHVKDGMDIVFFEKD